MPLHELRNNNRSELAKKFRNGHFISIPNYLDFGYAIQYNGSYATRLLFHKLR